ncbi:ABC transporter ATP-binding protein [Marinimicrobium alkaliphilum]|uniref:ABC transporter ATP-binding protein n=1 Tax=Marinimicrobium alkaliphilum TaxID=2202654 RepID=UPI000DBA0938|nr:ABC transporter ATP-binding protein [Marinimicrobium alkaliphilum]
MTEQQPLLQVENLRVAFHSRDGVTTAVDDMSFTLMPGQVLGIVGESGSGKSVSCYSLLGLIPCPPGRIERGRALLEGRDLLSLSEHALRSVRGRRIGMIFQDPMTSLNPYMRIGEQLIEPLREHRGLSRKAARVKALAMLEEVGIQDAAERIDAYPHEFSGGMRQRVMIAMALVNEPDILIADEPTTALDVTVQAQILTLIKSLQASYGLAVIFITHDLAVASQMADELLIMEKGVVVERGTPKSVFAAQAHPYTRKLIGAIPAGAKPVPSEMDPTDNFVKVNHLRTWFYPQQGLLSPRGEPLKAVDDVSLEIARGEILGLVGESGSGKSTLGRSMIRLVDSQSGEVIIDGVDYRALPRGALKKQRRQVQMIFQDPYASLNPRMTVFDTLAEPLRVHGLASRKNLAQQVNQLMDDVGLDRRFVRKYPHEFSGGQRQRIAIARALALQPRLIVADEPVSALDVTIQAQILDLLLSLSRKHHLTMLFISHDLAVVRYICDRVAVMHRGQLVEVADTEALFAAPEHPYTQSLLASIPLAQWG